MNVVSRTLAGMFGGLAASMSKILALDVEQLGQFVNNGNLDAYSELKVTILVFTPILMVLGGMIAWASNETNRMKALAIGCAAPALIAPWTSGKLETPPEMRAGLLITPAYAQQEMAQQQGTFYKGLRGLFGIESPNNQRYWVIVASYKNPAEAKAFASSVNERDPSIQAFVGQRQPNNEFYPVIVGGPHAYLPLAEAKRMQERANRIDIIPNNAYLSNFKDRLPAVGG